MKLSFAFALVLSLVPCRLLSTVAAPTAHAEKMATPRLVHFRIINMSGKSRAARVRGESVALPVGEAVALQVPVGMAVKITSDTDQSVSLILLISAADEGHLYPIT